MGTILVTGGAGFLGKHVAHSLAEAGQTVLVTYRRQFRRPGLLSDSLGSRIEAVRCDVMDLPALTRVIRDKTVVGIVHLANMSNYEGTIYQTMQTNIQGTINVLEAAALCSVKKLTYASSSSIAMSHGKGGPLMNVEDETVPIFSGPVSVISPSKKIGEILTQFYGATYGIATAIVRPGLIYGPYNETEIGSPGVLKSVLESLFAGKPAELPEAAPSDVVHMTYVRDVAAAISLVHLASANKHVVYGLDLGEPTTWSAIEVLLKEMVPRCSIHYGRVEKRAEEVQPASKDLNIASEFGFRAKYGIREGVSETVDWFRNGQC